ncbi:MAG: hypothetical protein JXR48_08055 [Candidatus Delongbacteria bacterium]|nr:hypothetical protein [Candidatus Delongbacteria bacterium]MBN2834906.1 hypothetical protein [Candidatus Delongbacteria bacterium]
MPEKDFLENLISLLTEVNQDENHDNLSDVYFAELFGSFNDQCEYPITFENLCDFRRYEEL